MLKKKSKGKLKTYIKPEQLRDTLVMTGREYIKTPEYQAEARKRWEPILKKWVEPQLKQFVEIAKQVNQHFDSLGIRQTIKKIQEQYSSILKDSQPKKIFITPKYRNSRFLITDLIEKISEKSAERIAESLKKKTLKSQKMILFLTEDGDLYCEPKATHCYRLRNERIRLKILKILSNKYKDTRIIESETGSSSTDAVRKAIGEINRKAKFSLKLKQELIESKPYSGYRINPLYVIRHVKY